MNDMDEVRGRWDYSTLPANVKLGPDCFIERKESFLHYRSAQPVGLALGARVLVYTWTAFSVDPSGTIQVGDDSILVGAIFMCNQSIEIGRRVVISYHVTIADSDFHPRDPALRRQDAIASAPHGDPSRRPVVESRPVVIGDDVEIGIGAYILKGVRIGNGARILPGAIVTRDVPAGAAAAGNPARLRRDAAQ